MKERINELRVCKRCGTPVKKERDSKLRMEYPYYCPNCDENLYMFETQLKGDEVQDTDSASNTVSEVSVNCCTTLVVVSEDGTDPSYMLLGPGAGDNIEASLQLAAKNAIKDGVACKDVTEIPDRYLWEQGLHRIPFRVTVLEREAIREKKAYEKAGISLATCRDCASYEGGICRYHGEKVSPEEAENCRHICGGEVVQLVYDGKKGHKTFSKYITIPSPFTPFEAAKLLNNTDFPDIQEFFQENGSDVEPENFRFRETT